MNVYRTIGQWSTVFISILLSLQPLSRMFFFFLTQCYVPFKIISLIETSQSVGKAKREYPGKTT